MAAWNGLLEQRNWKIADPQEHFGGVMEKRTRDGMDTRCRDAMWMRRVAYVYRCYMFKYAIRYAQCQVTSRACYAIWYERGEEVQGIDGVHNLRHRMRVS